MTSHNMSTILFYIFHLQIKYCELTVCYVASNFGTILDNTKTME